MRRTSGAATARSVISGAYTKRVSSLRTPRFHVTADPLDAAAVAALVAENATGAVTSFVGLVREQNGGRRVLWLDYEAYTPLAIKSFERIAAEAADRWPSAGLAIHHRIGRLATQPAREHDQRRQRQQTAAEEQPEPGCSGLARKLVSEALGEGVRVRRDQRCECGPGGGDKREDQDSQGISGASFGSGVSCGGRSASGTASRFTRTRVQVRYCPRILSTST